MGEGPIAGGRRKRLRPWMAVGAAVALGAVAILALLLLRRLEGLPDDARTYGHFWKLIYERIVHDERPGRPLMGPRTDPGAEVLRK